MRENKFVILVKCIIVIIVVTMLFMSIIVFIDEAIAKVFLYIFGILSLILLLSPIYKAKPSNSKTFKIYYNDLDEIKSLLLKNQYIQEKLQNTNTFSYTKDEQIIFLSYYEKLTDDIRYQTLLVINDYLNLNEYKNIIILLVVNKMSKSFKKFINNNVMQEFNYLFLPTGICFNSKTLYIYNSNDGNGFFKYESLKRKVIKLFKLK